MAASPAVRDFPAGDVPPRQGDPGLVVELGLHPAGPGLKKPLLPPGVSARSRRSEPKEPAAQEGQDAAAGFRRRVLVYTTSFPSALEPEHGVFVKERVRHLAALPGYSVRVVSPVPYFPKLRCFPQYYHYSQIPRRESVAGMPVVRPRYLLVPKLSLRIHGHSMYAGSRRAVRRLRAEFPFDLIDGHFIYPDGLAAVLLGRMANRPVVLTARGYDIRLLGEDPRARGLIRRALREADALIAVSADLGRRMVDLGASPEKLWVVPNGVDAASFHPVDPQAARRRLGLNGSGPFLVSAGHLIREKGHHLLVRAL